MSIDSLRAGLSDRYTIDRELGQGGMATVYLAEDLKHHRKVAIKVLRPDLAAALGPDRFTQEIEIAARLQHPHILGVYDSGQADGFLYYVMPYVEGESLRERLSREGELPVHEAVRLLAEVADALGYAHRQGVVHRDIKPENVMLSGRHALVMDFGVAKAVSEASGRNRLTTLGVALGTPAYMAPEQASADPHLDHRVDIYALGVMGYELLTGRPPFTGASPQQVLAAHVTRAPALVSVHRPAISPALASVIMKALEKRPADRWQTAEEMLAQLEPLATPSGGMTPTDTRPIVVAIPPRRWWAIVAAALTFVAVAVLAIVALRKHQGSLPSVASTAQVTTEAGLYLDPALSPDGKLLAYAAGPPAAMHIFIQQLGGGRILPLTTDTTDTTGTQRWPRWSPDGQQIAFVTESGIDIVPALGGVARQLVALQPGAWASPTWSPDGRDIAYSDATGIEKVDVATGRSSLVARHPPPNNSVSGYFDLQWSPDGRWIAASTGNMEFAFGRTGLGNIHGSSVVLVAADGHHTVTLARGSSAMEISPTWTPDSRHLLFVSTREGGRDVYEVAVGRDGAFHGTPTRLTTGLLAHSIFLARDGRTLAYASYTPTGNVWTIPVSDTGVVSVRTATQLTHGTDMIEETTVSPDHRTILITADRTGNSNLFTIPITGGPATQLTFDTANVFNGAWSKDGRVIAFLNSGDRLAYTVPAEGGVPQPIPTSRGTSRPDWSPDGNALVLGSGIDSLGRLVIIRRTAGAWGLPHAIAGTAHAGESAWSPDGRWIAYRTRIGRDSVAVAVIAPEGGTPRVLVRVGAGSGLERPIWSDDSRVVYYRSISVGRPDGIWAAPIAGGSPHELVRFDDPDRPGTPHVRYSVVDGVVYVRIVQHRSVLGVATLVQR